MEVAGALLAVIISSFSCDVLVNGFENNIEARILEDFGVHGHVLIYIGKKDIASSYGFIDLFEGVFNWTLSVLGENSKGFP